MCDLCQVPVCSRCIGIAVRHRVPFILQLFGYTRQQIVVRLVAVCNRSAAVCCAGKRSCVLVVSICDYFAVLVCSLIDKRTV